jgi:hypothetical protein
MMLAGRGENQEQEAAGVIEEAAGETPDHTKWVF